MDQTQILAQLSAIMQEVLDDPNVKLTRATTADDVEGWDSMSNITFVVEVERRFGSDRLVALIEAEGAKPPMAVRDVLLAAVAAFAPAREDDVTVLVARYQG